MRPETTASAAPADAMVAGLTRPTAQVVTAAALSVGYHEGISQASSFFLMVLPGPPEQVLVFADAAVAVDPSAAELAEIAVAVVVEGGGGGGSVAGPIARKTMEAYFELHADKSHPERVEVAAFMN